MTVAQAAEELNLSRRAVAHRIKVGTLAAEKIGEGRTCPYVITRAEVRLHHQSRIRLRAQHFTPDRDALIAELGTHVERSERNIAPLQAGRIDRLRSRFRG